MRIVKIKFRSLVAIVLLLVLISCSQSPQPSSPTPTANTFSGQVSDVTKAPVVGATVYLVPTSAIDLTRITASAINFPPYPAEQYDEPLEDTIRAKGATFTKVTTDAEGKFTIAPVPDGKFFIHITPAQNDTVHLPGSEKSRFAYPAENLRGENFTFKLSTRPPPDASYVGSTACLECHKENEAWKHTGHRVSFMPPGKPGPMQDITPFPEALKSISAFIETDSYEKGTHLEVGDRNPTKGSNKYLVRVFNDARLPIKTVVVDMYLWKNKADGKFFITMVNRINPKDPNSPLNLEVKLTYGGMVGRQRFVVSVPSQLNGPKGWYVFMEYHPLSNDDHLDFERRVWSDFYFDLWFSPGADRVYGTTDDMFKAPPPEEQNIQTMCAGCHFTGFQRFKDSATGQILSRAVNDPNGEVDIDGDGKKDEINIGCETCHGPGSKHGKDSSGNIVNEKYLSAERSTMVCGRCHDRRQGIGGPIFGYTMAINKD